MSDVDISRDAVDHSLILALSKAFHTATVCERGPAPRWTSLSEAQRQNTIRPMTVACNFVLSLPIPERQSAWASLQMVSDAIEQIFGPVASLESEEATLHRGPEYHHRAEGIIEALQRVRAALDRAEADRVPEVAAVPHLHDPDSNWNDFIETGVAEAQKAMRKFPQPNYVITKVAEEAGEVVKAAIHCAEGRETAENVRGEMRQLIAMLFRLWVEGDQVHGLPPVSAVLNAAAIRARGGAA